MNKLIVILGPTASGKTDLSVKLAKKFNGEVISADSRQVYKGMDIGSGKITKKEMQGIPHYLLDVANPKRKFSVAQYQKLANKAIKNIQKRNNLPFLVGGTAFYIYSVIDKLIIPKVKPNWKLRKKLEKLTVKKLFLKLKKLDPKRANVIDKNNPRRLIRALEIILKTKKPVPPLKFVGSPTPHKLSILEIGIKKTSEKTKKIVRKLLLKKKQKNAMINEVKKLLKAGVSYGRLEEFGLEYRFVAQYLQDKITYEEMVNKIQKESEHFAKRQMTWFKKDKRINWVKNYKEAEKLIKNFL